MRIVSIAKYLYFLLGILLLSSCLKEEEYVASKEQERRQSAVDEFRLHFDASYDEDRLRSLSSAEGEQPLLFKGLQPMWEHAKLDKYSLDLESVEVPLKADELYLAIPQTLSPEDIDKYQRKVFSLSLLREYNPHTKFKQEFFVCYLPSKEQLEKGLPRNYRLATLPKDYEGEIILFSLDLKPLYRYRIGNGQIEEKYIATKAKNSLRGWVREEICTWAIIDTSWYVYQEGRPEDAVYHPRFKLDVICRSRCEWQPEHIPDVDNGVIPNVGGDGYNDNGRYYGGSGGGGSSSGNSGSMVIAKIYAVPLRPGLNQIIRDEDLIGFDNVLKAKLNKAYDEMLSDDLYKRIDELIGKSGKKLVSMTCVKDIKGAAASVSNEWQFTFYGIDNIDKYRLSHEWLHMAQMVLNRGVVDKNGVKVTGQLEFEGWVLRDIIKMVNKESPMAYTQEPWAITEYVYEEEGYRRQIEPDYGKWLDLMTGGGKHYPEGKIDSATFKDAAKRFLKKNNSYKDRGYSTNVEYTPNLLNNIFDKTEKK